MFFLQELSPNDKLKKETKDLLHAELTNTLKRRKPVVIKEPPKYEYPTYDDDSSKQYESSHSSKNAAAAATTNNTNNNNSIITPIAEPKPLNVNAVLSMVTGIKLSDIQYDPKSNNSASKPPIGSDKVKISHGKPNFVVNQKENRPKVPSSSSPSALNKSTELKCQHPSNGSAKSTVTTDPYNIKSDNVKSTNSFDIKPVNMKSTNANHPTNGKLIDVKPVNSKPIDVKLSGFKSANVKPMPETDSESQVKKCKSIFLLKSQNSIENGNVTLKKERRPSASNAELVSKFEITPISNVTVNNRLNRESPEKQLKKQTSIDGPSNGISFVNVANKKALFEKSAPSESIPTAKSIQTSKKPTTTLEISNGEFNTLNGHRIIRSSSNQTNRIGNSNGTTNVSVNRTNSYGSMNQSPTKDRVDHFEQTVHTMNETTTTNKLGQTETRQFQQKTVVSFSKDLRNAPNNHPEQIRVKKTVVTERSNTSQTTDIPFQNIRFSIQSNGQVIPRAK